MAVNMAVNNATLVLVHSAWADGSSCGKGIAPLAASGAKAVAAPLPLTSFHDDVAALDRTFEPALLSMPPPRLGEEVGDGQERAADDAAELAGVEAGPGAIATRCGGFERLRGLIVTRELRAAGSGASRCGRTGRVVPGGRAGPHDRG
jgi:hypothetical protein